MRTRQRKGRYEPTVAYMMAEQARSAGVDLDAVPGPWRACWRRRDLALISVATNGRTEVMVDTMRHAIDVAGLLNWCCLEDFQPVPDLVPPFDSELVEDEQLRAAG
jgi:hypothetical protein